MSKMVLILSAFSIGLSLWSLELNRRTMKTWDNLAKSSNALKFKKEHHIAFQLQELKKLQEQTSDKISNCSKDKSCYSNKSYKNLIWELRNKASIIDVIYGEACPSFKADTENYWTFTKNVETISNRTINPKILIEENIPNVLEEKTKDLITKSFESCKEEHDRKVDI